MFCLVDMLDVCIVSNGILIYTYAVFHRQESKPEKSGTHIRQNVKRLRKVSPGCCYITL